jgi:hypothetical protein
VFTTKAVHRRDGPPGRLYNFTADDSAAAMLRRTTKAKILCCLEKILLGGFLGVLCVLAVNADPQINRQVAKDAKKTPSKTIW